MIFNFNKYTFIFLGIVLSVALCVIIGWQFNIEGFKMLVPGAVSMNPVTAICFILSVAAFALYKIQNKYSQLCSIILSIIIVLIGLIKFTDIIFNIHAGIDGWLFPGKLNQNIIDGKPNRMAPNTALNFIFTGCSILLLGYKKQKNYYADYFALATVFIAFVSLIGYLYGTIEFEAVPSFIPMAVHSAICFLLISLTILFDRSTFGFFSLFTRKYQGSKMARFLVPMAIIIPVVLGMIQLYGEGIGLYSLRYGVALFAAANVIVFVYLIWRSAIIINRSDKALNNEIENRKIAEQEARLNERFLDTIIENLPDLIFVKEVRNLTFVRVNKATEKITGISRQELIGKNGNDYLSPEQAAFFSQRDYEVIKANKLLDIPEARIGIPGNERWLHTKKIPINDEKGTPTFLIGISQDITERKIREEQILQFNKELETKVIERTNQLYSSEKKFRSLIENSRDIICLMDKRGKILYINPSALTLAGYTIDEIDHLSVYSIILPEDTKKAFSLLRKVLKNPGILYQETFRIMHKTGSYSWVVCSLLNLLHDEDVHGLVANCHDITTRMKAEEEKMKMAELVMQEKIHQQVAITQATIDGQEKEKKEVAMELHDNVNQLLASINLFLLIARRQPTLREEMINKSFEIVQVAIEEIRKLSKNMLPPMAGAGEALYSINELVNLISSATNMKIHVNISEESMAMLDDKSHLVLYRILQEQLNNITKHAHATKVFIEGIIHDKYFEFKIRDNGKGFDLSLKHFGIGLSNIRSRIEAINGTFEILSLPGKGCILAIRLPVIKNQVIHARDH